MRATWLATVLVVAACSNKSETAPSSETAKPIAPPKPAPLAAAAATAPTGAIVAELENPMPEAGFTFAAEIGDSLAIVKLDRTGFHTKTVMPVVHEATHIAWVDSKTLVEMARPTVDDKPVVSTIVDGAVTNAVELDEVWAGGKLQTTASGEVWVDRCAHENDDGECTRTEYKRVYPASPVKVQGSAPRGWDPDAIDLLEWPTPAGVTPPVAPPAGYAIEKAKLPANADDEKPKLITIARCRVHGGFPVDYPTLPLDTDDLAAMRFAVKDVHWVVTEPPIYEVSAVHDDGTNTGKVEPEITYWLACQNRPLSGFLGLGGTLWALQSGDTWEFHAGTTELGRLRAGALHRAPQRPGTF
jgi:hypothetical protein